MVLFLCNFVGIVDGLPYVHIGARKIDFYSFRGHNQQIKDGKFLKLIQGL
jgi:hypothetical protein